MQECDDLACEDLERTAVNFQFTIRDAMLLTVVVATVLASARADSIRYLALGLVVGQFCVLAWKIAEWMDGRDWSLPTMLVAGIAMAGALMLTVAIVLGALDPLFPTARPSPARIRSWPNDPSSATRPAERVDGSQSAIAGFAAAHG